MNYFVVSPNAWNDGNVADYLEYMKLHRVVFMGWDKKNRRGKMFSDIQCGDRIIVASGANWQKKIFFAGIVDLPADYDDTSGYCFSQFVELRSMVLLEKGDLPFQNECSYGKSRCHGAIYKLNQANEYDVKIIDKLEKMLQSRGNAFTLREIANWVTNKRVAIPALQRGLVWSPLQVELLWDSILRGFPVGAFVITSAPDNRNQKTAQTTADAEYFLLDGQQRFNAIQLGFSDASEQSNAMLWIDLLRSRSKNSSRKY